MKRPIIVLLLAVLLVFSFGCSDVTTAETDPVSESIESQIVVEETESESSTEQPETTVSEEETASEFVRSFADRENYLYIGVYHLQGKARTEEHIKDLADSGVDYVLCMGQEDRKTLDLFAKYGLGAIVTGVLPYSGPAKSYKEQTAKMKDHPAIWGLYFADEPSALYFSHMGLQHAAAQEARPEKLIYVNLYPNYASVAGQGKTMETSQLGTNSYEEYIEEYCRNFTTDFMCFDFYPYSWSSQHIDTGISNYYENFRVVAEACHNTGRAVWFVGQVNSNRRNTFITTNQIRFQAFTGMAFGAEHIEWGCYSGGWWYNNVLDENGVKTEQYDKMKTVNWEIHTIAEEYMKYRNVTTHFVGFAEDDEKMKYVQQKPIAALSTEVFSDVRSDDGSPLVIGEMVSRTEDGSYALMICASDDPLDKENKSYNIVFRADNFDVSAFGGNGEIPVTVLDDGSYSVPICSNAGILLVAE